METETLERVRHKYDLVNIFYDLLDHKDNEELLKINEMNVTADDIKLINTAVELRKGINGYLKGVSNIPCYKRANEDKIDFQAMLTEMMFAKFLWEKYKYVSKSFKNDFEIKSPEIASIFLNHREEDFHIKYEDEKVEFDLKSQFINNKYQSININQKAHERFKAHDTDFYVVGLIDGDPADFSTVTKVNFVMIPNKYFQQHAKEVNTANTNFFSPYYKIDIKPFKDLLNMSP